MKFELFWAELKKLLVLMQKENRKIINVHINTVGRNLLLIKDLNCIAFCNSKRNIFSFE